MFFHSPDDGHLGCFQYLAIKHEAAINTAFRSLCDMFSFPSGGDSGGRLLTHGVSASLTSQGTAALPSAAAVLWPSRQRGASGMVRLLHALTPRSDFCFHIRDDERVELPRVFMVSECMFPVFVTELSY